MSESKSCVQAASRPYFGSVSPFIICCSMIVAAIGVINIRVVWTILWFAGIAIGVSMLAAAKFFNGKWRANLMIAFILLLLSMDTLADGESPATPGGGAATPGGDGTRIGSPDATTTTKAPAKATTTDFWNKGMGPLLMWQLLAIAGGGFVLLIVIVVIIIVCCCCRKKGGAGTQKLHKHGKGGHGGHKGPGGGGRGGVGGGNSQMGGQSFNAGGGPGGNSQLSNRGGPTGQSGRSGVGAGAPSGRSDVRGPQSGRGPPLRGGGGGGGRGPGGGGGRAPGGRRR